MTPTIHRSTLLFVSALVIGVIVPLGVRAQSAPASRNSASTFDQSKQPVIPIVVPIYKPPVSGAPGGRVGGGTRSGDQTFVLSVLAPNLTGLTAEDQPVLYWYLSKPLSSSIEFTINDGSTTPLLEKTLTPPFEPGLQRLRLSEFGVHLAAGKQYQWFVGLVSDSKRRSKDILAGATIERIERSAVPVIATDRVATARRHAEAGYWYDAIALLSEQIEATPADSIARSQRAALLQQVGLHEIADYDLSLAGAGKER
jgi:hypothetical protein